MAPRYKFNPHKTQKRKAEIKGGRSRQVNMGWRGAGRGKEFFNRRERSSRGRRDEEGRGCGKGGMKEAQQRKELCELDDGLYVHTMGGK